MDDIKLIGTVSMSEDKTKIQGDLNKLKKQSERNQEKGRNILPIINRILTKNN